MLQYQTRLDVRSVLRACGLHARSRHGAAITRGSTVYLGLASRRWTLKLYSKGDEIQAQGKNHGLPHAIEHYEDLTTYADTALRVELQLRQLELKRHELDLAVCWSPSTPLEVLRSKLEGITMATLHTLPSQDLQYMPGRLVAVYEAWRAGHDLRALYAKTTFYRYRRELLELGIDIADAPPLEPTTENVVPLNRLLEGHLATIPDWAHNTPLYFDPPTLTLKEAV